MSGVAGAWCNGRPATLVRGSIDCVVPLRDGFIDVIVTVMEVPGNSSSASTQLSRVPFTSTIVRRQDTKGGSVSPLFMAEREVLMLRLNAKRDVRVVRLAAFKDADVQALPSIKLGRVVPDGQGGLLTLMELGFRDGHKEGRVVRLVKDTKTTYPLPAAGEYALGPDQAFTTDGQTLVAFDPISGKVHWIRQSTTDRMWLDYATNDGVVVLHTARVMFRFNADGSGPVRVGPPQP